MAGVMCCSDRTLGPPPGLACSHTRHCSPLNTGFLNRSLGVSSTQLLALHECSSWAGRASMPERMGLGVHAPVVPGVSKRTRAVPHAAMTAHSATHAFTSKAGIT